MDSLRGFKKIHVSERNGCGQLLIGISLLLITAVLVQGCFLNVSDRQYSKIRKGMTKEEVLKILGEPREKDMNDGHWTYNRGFGGLMFIFFNDDDTVGGTGI